MMLTGHLDVSNTSVLGENGSDRYIKLIYRYAMSGHECLIVPCSFRRICGQWSLGLVQILPQLSGNSQLTNVPHAMELLIM